MSVTGNPHRPARSPAWLDSVAFDPTAGAPRGPARHALHAVLARWFADHVDRELAAGLSPRASAVVECRAAQLTGARNRRRIAAGLARIQRDCSRDPLSMTAVVSPDRHEVLAAKAVLTAVAQRLTEERPVDPQGMAMLQVLLTDGNGPLYEPVGAGSVGSHLRAAAAALEPGAR